MIAFSVFLEAREQRSGFEELHGHRHRSTSILASSLDQYQLNVSARDCSCSCGVVSDP